MQNLIKNNKKLFLILLLLNQCTSVNGFKVFNEGNERTELLFFTDRILVKCHDLEAQDPPKDHTKDGKYLFYIYILDEENTVSSVGMDNIFYRKDCFEKKEITDSIIQKSKQIYIGGMFSFRKPRIKGKRTHFFPKYGTFYENGHHLQYVILKGDNGKCTTALNGEACIGEGFPIKQMPF